jgi:lipopolysaccharide heptosyltransferase I
MRILVVRLSSLGDVVHTIPAVAALRHTFPDARIDWLVAERCRELVELVTVVDRVIPVGASGRGLPLRELVRTLRGARYDLAVDFQGLLKSATLSKVAGARRVVGFERSQLRERWAAWLYTETIPVGSPTHVVEKNLALAAGLGAPATPKRFPIAVRSSDVVGRTRDQLGIGAVGPFIAINPGAAWSSKCWEPERFGELAARLCRERGLRSAVVWGPGEEGRARAVTAASQDAAVLTEPTGVADLVALAREASLVIAGDTGPLHIAAAVGTPVVGLYGPSDPSRNGPWAVADVVVSRFAECGCRRARAGSHGVVVRRCQQPRQCLSDVTVDEVARAVTDRIGATGHA